MRTRTVGEASSAVPRNIVRRYDDTDGNYIMSGRLLLILWDTKIFSAFRVCLKSDKSIRGITAPSYPLTMTGAARTLQHYNVDSYTMALHWRSPAHTFSPFSETICDISCRRGILKLRDTQRYADIPRFLLRR